MGSEDELSDPKRAQTPRPTIDQETKNASSNSVAARSRLRPRRESKANRPLNFQSSDDELSEQEAAMWRKTRVLPRTRDLPQIVEEAETPKNQEQESQEADRKKRDPCPSRDTRDTRPRREAAEEEDVGSTSESPDSDTSPKKARRNKNSAQILPVSHNEAVEELTFIIAAATSANKLTAVESRVIRNLLLTINAEHSRALADRATIQGQLEESRFQNKRLLDHDKQQTSFFRSCADVITEIHKVSTTAIVESNARQENEIARIRETNKSLSETVSSTLNQIVENGASVPTMHSYSEITKKPHHTTPRHRQAANQTNSILLVYPKQSNKHQTSEETKNLIQKEIKPTQLGIRISKVSKIRNGGIALELPKDQMNAVAKKLETTLDTHEPKKKLPKIKIFDVPSTKDSDQEVLESLRLQNFPNIESTNFHKNIKIVYKVGPKNKTTHHWVLEMNPDLLRDFHRLNGRIYLHWQSLKIIDHIIVARCYKCQRYGHLAKECRTALDTCGHCAVEGHTFNDCPEKRWDFKCVNCLRANQDHKHNVNSTTCPSYLREKRRIASQTDYGH